MTKMDRTRGAHARLEFVKKVYTYELQRAEKTKGDDEQERNHIVYAMRAYLLYLLGTMIFVEKSATYTDVIYLLCFEDFERIHEYNCGVACLVYLYSKLSEGCRWKTNQITGSITLLTAWILQNFLHISGWASVPTYTENMLCATEFSLLKGNQSIESFRMYLECLVADDMHLNNYVYHRETRPFDDIVLYSGWLACGSRLTARHLPERVMR
ncbi:unnamed protein product [Lathyrus oleraceus]